MGLDNDMRQIFFGKEASTKWNRDHLIEKNANGTLVMLENVRHYCPDATFIFCSTNKVYGDRPNLLPLVEMEKRWEIEKDSTCYQALMRR